MSETETDLDGWRGNLYACPVRGFPIFARLRLIKESMGYPNGATIADFARVISFGPNADKPAARRGIQQVSEPTAKNILWGKIKGPKFPKGGSVIRDDYLQNLHSYLLGMGRSLPAGILDESMTEDDFRQAISTWRSNFVRKELAIAGPTEVPNTLGLEPRWSQAGLAHQSKLDSWWAARTKAATRAQPALNPDSDRRSTGPGTTQSSNKRLEAQRSIGIFAPTRYGKSELVSRWIRSHSISNVCWLDCKTFTSREFLIDGLLARLCALQKVDVFNSGLVNAKLEDKKRAVEHQLERFAHGLVIFDSVESFVFDAGELPSENGEGGERPKDQMAIDFLKDLIQRSPVPAIFISQHSLSMLTGLQWVELKEPAWQPKDGSEPFPVDELAQADLALVVKRARVTTSKNSLTAETIVESIFQNLSVKHLKLFAFIVLIGERVRYSTLRWFCTDYLEMPAGDIDSFIDCLWRKCSLFQAVAITMHCDLEHDSISEEERADAALHFKFHDTITEIAAGRLERETDPELTSEIHLKIAERARSIMRELKYYAAKNVVGRFTRPAQVVKHLAASIRAGDLRNALSHYKETSYLIPPAATTELDRVELEKQLQGWEISGIFRSKSSIEDRYRYAFELLYRGIIDRTHQLSRVNGADNAKVDLLRRFFPPIDGDTSLAALVRRDRSTFPALPVNLLTELLAAISVAGLNAGQLPLAKWASETAMKVLADWRQHFGLSDELHRFFAFMTRVRVDILTRAGDLPKANDLCFRSLTLPSDYMLAARPEEIYQLQLRYAHIMYLTSSVTSAIKYLKTIGLDVPKVGAETNPQDFELNGLSARIWVSLLLKTIRGGRHAEEDAATLQWASRLLEANWAKAQGRANERVALMVQRSIIDRISLDAVRSRKQDIIDWARLPECRKVLKEAEILAWNSGVSPATRIELEFEIAKVEFLLGHYKEALDVVARLEGSTTASGYRIYQFEAIFLHAEILWELGELKRRDGALDAGSVQEFRQAEELLISLVALEEATGFYAAHASRLLVLCGVSPTKQRIV